MLRSPTESRFFDSIATISSKPESMGVDFCFMHEGEWYGVQRKEMKDFVASVYDGRLSKELGQMGALKSAVLLIEGEGGWTLDGTWMGGWKWTREMQRGYLWTVKSRGVQVESSLNMADTRDFLQHWESWVKKGNHTAGRGREGASGAWGKATNREWLVWMLTGFEGIGVELAERIVEELGCPITWVVTEGELLGVKGLGKKRVRNLLAALDGEM